MNTKKPPGWDSVIPPIVFKEISHAISLSLQSIFNQCIEDCSWPTKWKMGEWTPVFKKGERQFIQNYGPITVLPLIGKIFEHVLCKQITAVRLHQLAWWRTGDLPWITIRSTFVIDGHV